MSAGIRTTDVDPATLVDSLIGNRDGSTIAITIERLAAIIAALMGPSYTTRALLYADLSWPSGSIGYVRSDATTAYIGVYKKAGAAGSGSWSRIGDLPSGAVEAAAITALEIALALKAPLASPALTGTPTAPTAAVGTNTTQIATTAHVQAALAALVGGAPGALNTLQELAAALNNDPAFFTTITAALGLTDSKARAALAVVGAELVTATRSGVTWTIGWSNCRIMVGSSLLVVQDLAPLALGSGEVLWIDLDTAVVPYVVTRSGLGDTMAGDIAAGRKRLLLRNASGALSGPLADTCRLALAQTGLATDIAARATRDELANETLRGRAAEEILADRVDAEQTRAEAAEAAGAALVSAETTRARDAEAQVGAGQRPGDMAATYGAVLTGTLASIAPLSPALAVADSTMGAVLAITTATAVAPRAATAIEPGRVYALRAAVRRAANPADPLNDAVQLGVAWLTHSFGPISPAEVVLETIALTAAQGAQYRSLTLSLDVAGVDAVIPAAARYARPFLRTYGAGHDTRVARVELIDITDAWAAKAAAAAATSGLAAKADAAAVAASLAATDGKGAAGLAAAMLGAATLTATLAGVTWTLGWTGLRLRVLASGLAVQDLAPVALASGEALVIDIQGGVIPYVPVKAAVDGTLADHLSFGRRLMLLANTAGTLSGPLADHARLALAQTGLATDITARATRGELAAATDRAAAAEAILADRIDLAETEIAARPRRSEVPVDQLWVLPQDGLIPVLPIDQRLGMLGWYDPAARQIVIPQLRSVTTAVRAVLPANLVLPAPAATRIYGVIAYGQSLAIGADGGPALTTVQYLSNITFGAGPKTSLSGNGHGGSNQSAMNSSKALVEDDLTPDGAAGRGETGLAQAVNGASQLAYQTLSVPVANLVHFASTAGNGGEGITELAKLASPDGANTQNYYSNFANHVTRMKAVCDGLGKTLVISAVLWSQGEADREMAAATYKTHLIAIIAAMQADVMAATGQTVVPHILIHQQGAYLTTHNSGGPAQAQFELAHERADVHLLGGIYHLPTGDGVHLTNIGYARRGRQLARALVAIEAEGRVPPELRPLSAGLFGAEVHIRFAVPTAPLLIDTDALPPTEDFGFRVTSASGDSTITGARIAADGVTLILTLASAPGASPVVRGGLDYLGAGLGWDEGASTNLRDSTDDPITLAGTSYPTWSVCPAFSLPIQRFS